MPFFYELIERSVQDNRIGTLPNHIDPDLPPYTHQWQPIEHDRSSFDVASNRSLLLVQSGRLTMEDSVTAAISCIDRSVRLQSRTS